MPDSKPNDEATQDGAGGPVVMGPTVSATPGDDAAPAQNNVQGPHPNPISLWAAGIGTPLRFDDNDARLPNPATGDQPFGQDGWQVGLDFKDFAHLGDLLGGGQFTLPSFVCKNSFLSCGPIEENQIMRLAILAHGAPAGIDVDGAVGQDMNGSGLTEPRLLNVNTLSRYSKPFDQILKVLAFRAKVFFMSCIAGAGPDGDALLMAISNVWAAKEVFVIGYKSVLYCGAQGKVGTQGASCYPGARETHYSNNKKTPETRYYETGAAWTNLDLLPWATEITTHATQAFRGMLLKTGQEGSSPWTPP